MSDRENNFECPTAAQLKIPVKGPEGRGHLYLYASKEELAHHKEWELKRAELEVDRTTLEVPGGYEGKRMVLFDVERHGPISEYLPVLPGQRRID